MYRHHNDGLRLSIVVVDIRQQRGLLQKAVEVALGILLAVAPDIVAELGKVRHTLLILFGLVCKRQRIACFIKYRTKEICKRHGVQLFAQRVDELSEGHKL